MRKTKKYELWNFKAADESTRESNQKFWDEALELVKTLKDNKHWQILRPSNSIPGILVGTVVKIVDVVQPKQSFYNRSLPYVHVHIEMPNGEFRSINAEALTVSTEKKWNVLKNAYAKLK